MNRPLPEDPMVRSIVRMIRGAQMDRRQLLRGAAAGAAGIGALGLASCAGGGGGGGGDGIIWGNWTYYLDYDSDTDTNPSLEAFMEQSGFNVQYIEDIDDNNTFYGKIKDQLKLDQFTGYDVITFTDWMNARIIEANQVQEFDYANMPTVKKNLVDSQWDALDVDPGRKFSVPWQLPASGWVWNTKEVPRASKRSRTLCAPNLRARSVCCPRCVTPWA